MQLYEMLDIIDARLPSAFTENAKIMFLNAYIRLRGRHLGRRELFQFSTAPGIELYPFYVPTETVRTVTVDGKEYLPRRYPEEIREQTYYFDPAGFIGLYPVPQGESVTVRVLYDGAEPFLTREELEDVDAFLAQDGGLDDEYAEAVVFGALADMAAASEELTLCNNFTQRYEAIVKAAMQGKYNKRGKYPLTKDVTSGTSRKFHCWRRCR